MNEWNDADLGVLLVETFASREHLAEPGAANRIATSSGRSPRRWVPVLAAAAVLLVVGTTIALTGHGDTETPPSAPAMTTPITTTASDADNRSAAQRAARRAIDLAPIVTPAQRIGGQPADWPDGGMSVGFPDSRLTLTAWFSTTLDADQVEQLLVTSPPEDFYVEGYKAGEPHSGVGGGSDGVRNLVYQPLSEMTAYTGPTLLVQWRDMGAVTVLRFDAFVAARKVRSAETFVNGEVSSVDLSRVTERMTGFPAKPDDHRTVTDPPELMMLTNGVNALPGTTDPQPIGSCPFTPATTYTLTFHTARTTTRFQWVSSCWGQVQVSVAGLALAPTLSPDGLTESVDRLIAGLPPFPQRG